MTAAAAAIDQVTRATAALTQSAKSLDEGLAILPEDAELKAAREAVAGVIAAKQTQLKAQQDSMANLIAEKQTWEQGIAERRQAIADREAEMNTANVAIAEVDKQLQAAVAAVEKAAAVAAERATAVGEREASVNVAEAELNTLQGITST